MNSYFSTTRNDDVSNIIENKISKKKKYPETNIDKNNKEHEIK